MIVCVPSVLMRACDGQKDLRLVNGFFKQSGSYCVLFSFCDRNAATGKPHSSIYLHAIVSQWTPRIDLKSAPSHVYSHSSP